MRIRSDWRDALRRVIGEREWAPIARAAKLNPTYLRDILERNQEPQLKNAEKLSIALGVNVTEWFLETGLPKTEHTINQPAKSSILGFDKSSDPSLDAGLKVLGMAEGGPDGWALWNGDVIEIIPRPAYLAGVRDAYAVYITGDSMTPRYNAGERIYINPAKPVTPGCYVLVQKKPMAEGETPLAVVKQLIRRTGNKIILQQENPKKQFDVKADEVVSIHRIVGSSEA